MQPQAPSGCWQNLLKKSQHSPQDEDKHRYKRAPGRSTCHPACTMTRAGALLLLCAALLLIAGGSEWLGPKAPQGFRHLPRAALWAYGSRKGIGRSDECLTGSVPISFCFQSVACCHPAEGPVHLFMGKPEAYIEQVEKYNKTLMYWKLPIYTKELY